MADRISDQCFDLAVGLYACSDVGIQDCGKIRQLVNGLENELLAARARIAKLEQEPPMTLVDFGYGLDLQGIRDDLKFLDDVRKQNQELRAEVERLRGMLARLCIAVEHSAPGYGVYEDWGDICDGDFLALRLRLDEAKALLAKHKETP